MVQITISKKMAEELKFWAIDEKAFWPDDTVFQSELSDLIKQIEPTEEIEVELRPIDPELTPARSEFLSLKDDEGE